MPRASTSSSPPPSAIRKLPLCCLRLEKGFPFKDGTDLGGFTSLRLAVIGNNFPSVRLLLAKGADPNAANTFAGKVKFGLIDLRGISPLMFAGSVGSPEMVTAARPRPMPPWRSCQCSSSLAYNGAWLTSGTPFARSIVPMPVGSF